MMNNFTRIKPQVFPVEKVVIPEANPLNLKNGVPVFFIEAGTEDIMRVEFTFKAGQIKENLPLLASTTNMMLSEGSQNYSSEEINRMLDFYGVFFNLSVEKDRAGITFYFLNKHIEKVLDLGREMIYRPVFPKAELNSLMNKRLSWYRVNKEKVQNLASDKFFESVFGREHPYGRQVTEEDFGTMNPEILKLFHSRYYTPANMAIIISGRLHKNTHEFLEYFFGNLTSEHFIENHANSPTGEAFKRIHIEKTDAIQSAVKIGSATINKRHDDYHGLKIVDSILGGYFGSRLMKNIREDKGYTYGISSSVFSLDLSGYKVISTEVAKDNCQKTINEIYKEIRLLQSVPVKNDELEVVRNYISGEMIRMFDGPFALAESFRSAWEFGLDNNYYYRLADKIKTISPDEIIELAQTYYNIEELYEIIVG